MVVLHRDLVVIRRSGVQNAIFFKPVSLVSLQRETLTPHPVSLQGKTYAGEEKSHRSDEQHELKRVALKRRSDLKNIEQTVTRLDLAPEKRTP
jgi:hypothetical protein